MVLRGLLIFAVIAALSALAAWLADNPGDVAMQWRGWRIDTTFAALLLAVAAVSVVVAMIYRFWRAVVHTPRALARSRRERRQRKGYEALTRGLVAVAAGDPDEARRQARTADSRLEQPPLTLLLSAQAAQLEGREAAAKGYFTAMLDRPETEFLGLRGLIIQADRAGDREAGLSLARRAHRLRPKTHWVLTTLFEKEAAAGNWRDADRTLQDAIKHGAIDAEQGKRKRAVVLLQQAQVAEAAGDTAGALKHARKAQEIDPGFRAAAVDLVGRLLAAGKHRQVARLIERSWAAAPHPDLARAYGDAVKAKDPVRRFQDMERLAALNPAHVESRLALAQAALDARLWGEARRQLSEIPAGGERAARFCRLMAEIEEAEHGNTAELRQWLARAAEAPPDPGWVCDSCGAVAMAWQAICGHCGAFGEIDWRTPPRSAPAIMAPAETPVLAPAEPVDVEPVTDVAPRSATAVQ